MLSKLENENFGSPEKRKRTNTTYLPHTPNSPIKIATNLDEAKDIDPQIVKFTEYKIKFLEPRVQKPQVLTLTSPLRFRRKEEVIKHLVTNNIVEKESNSIEFVG